MVGAQLICVGSDYIQSKPLPEISICFHSLLAIPELLRSVNPYVPPQPDRLLPSPSLGHLLLSSGRRLASWSPNMVLPTSAPSSAIGLCSQLCTSFQISVSPKRVPFSPPLHPARESLGHIKHCLPEHPNTTCKERNYFSMLFKSDHLVFKLVLVWG